MMLATNYFINAPDIDEISHEFNILYKKDSKIKDLITFAEKYPEHRIIISFEDNEVDYSVLDIIKKLHPHVSVRLTKENMNEIPNLQKRAITFFLDTDMPAYNYTTLDMLIKLGVADVYIADDLFYDLVNVSKVCRSNNVRIRLILNRIPSTAFDKGVNPRSPIITPQMRQSLDRYINVAEFELGETTSIMAALEKLRTLIKIWFKDEYWLGQLADFNSDIQLSVPCPNYLIDTSYKWSCRRHCCSIPNSRCKRCQEWLDLANVLLKKNVIFRKVGKEE